MPAIPNSNQNSRLPAHSHRLWFPAAVALLAARDGFLYGLDDDLLARVENPSGVRKWNDGRYASGQAVLVDDQVIVRSEPAPVALVEAGPDSFEELGRIPALNGKTWNHPPLAGRYLLVRNSEEAGCYEFPCQAGEATVALH